MVTNNFPTIEDLINEKFSAFESFKKEFTLYYRNYIRDLPSEIHRTMRDWVIRALSLSTAKLKIRITVDTNIIVSDAIRVANGKQSSTIKLFSSPYVEIYAPKNITNEVIEKLKERVKDQLQLNKAISHARLLLSKVKIIDKVSDRALSQARSALEERDQKDVPFLAVSIYTGSNAILSRDSDFDSQRLVKRWTMGEGADIILTYEEGAFSMFVIAKTFDILLSTFAKLLLVLFNAIVQIAKYFAQLIEALYSKSLDIISKLPKWLIAGVLTFAISIWLIALVSKEFRDGVTTFFNELWETFEPNIRKLIITFYDLFKVIYNAIKDLTVCIASMVEQMAPYFIIAFGILMDCTYKLFHMYKLFNVQ